MTNEGTAMHIIKSVGVLSVAKVAGASYGALGLIMMPFFTALGLLGLPGGRQSSFGAITGLALGVMSPIFYGLMGFVGGAIGAFVYNLLAKWLGGIEIQLGSAFAAAPFPETTTSSIPG